MNFKFSELLSDRTMLLANLGLTALSPTDFQVWTSFVIFGIYLFNSLPMIMYRAYQLQRIYSGDKNKVFEELEKEANKHIQEAKAEVQSFNAQIQQQNLSNERGKEEQEEKK